MINWKDKTEREGVQQTRRGIPFVCIDSFLVSAIRGSAKKYYPEEDSLNNFKNREEDV